MNLSLTSEQERLVDEAHDELRRVIDATPALIHTARADGYLDYFNRGWLDFLGGSLNEVCGWRWTNFIHPEDVADIVHKWHAALASGNPFEAESRVRRADGEYRLLLHRKVPVRDDEGKIVKWFGASIDIEDRKRAEALLGGEKRILEMLATGDSLGAILDSLCRLVEEQASGALASILLIEDSLLRHGGAPSLPKAYTDAIDGVPIGPGVGSCGTAAHTGKQVIVEDISTDPLWADFRAAALPHSLRACWSTPIFSAHGKVIGTFAMYYREPRKPGARDQQIIKQITHLAGLAIERKLTYEQLERSEAYRAEAEKLTHTGSFAYHPATKTTRYWSDEVFRVFEIDPDHGILPFEETRRLVHPDDLVRTSQTILNGFRDKADFEVYHRILLDDGTVKHLHEFWHPVLDKNGEVLLYVGTVADITQRVQAEDELRRSEAYLAEAQRLSHTGSFGWNTGSGEVVWSEETFRIFEIDPATTPTIDLILSRVHPGDRQVVEQILARASVEGQAFDLDHRLTMPTNSIKHVHVVARVVGHQSCGFEYVGAVMDVTSSRLAFQEIQNLKDQLFKENIAFREEIDQSLMLEEIVGTSEPLRRVLAHIAKVAPTESTVLVTGETGTGKELIARAIHKRSPRSNRPFIRLNCAAVPPSLVASELFGHEKGAFTGATQRRPGRFEMADGGTLFLDEIGELPADTQIALLRVLQEREIERLGGTQVIHVDVRVIAATNRELQSAIVAGKFRQDLFYRLNVFPIHTPSLRERKDDIPLLVGYLIDRFATRTGKKIKHIAKRTLELFQEYDWPGNIRELQNLIERAVILCDGDTLLIDETWLQMPSPRGGEHSVSLELTLDIRERDMIEGALAACKGRVAGPTGAAMRLGIPRSTLESRIKSLGIDKWRFKA